MGFRGGVGDGGNSVSEGKGGGGAARQARRALRRGRGSRRRGCPPSIARGGAQGSAPLPRVRHGPPHIHTHTRARAHAHTPAAGCACWPAALRGGTAAAGGQSRDVNQQSTRSAGRILKTAAGACRRTPACHSTRTHATDACPAQVVCVRVRVLVYVNEVVCACECVCVCACGCVCVHG